MRRLSIALAAAAILLSVSERQSKAETVWFGSGANRFSLDFVPISGSTNPTGGYGIVNHNYRMGTYEITNDQWNKFTTAYGTVTGSPSKAYDDSFHDWGTGKTNVPTNNVTWYEAAQFVNWLNTSTGHQVAYKFTGTQGTGDYTFATWSTTDTGYDAGNPYRNKAAFYFLPTEDEWVKAAYWNGTALQEYATKAGESLTQGNGTGGTGWNYLYDGKYATDPYGPWNVGSGSQELNGTYDMMGNNWEWMESPWTSGDYGASSSRVLRGSAWNGTPDTFAAASGRYTDSYPSDSGLVLGFRVASIESVAVPAPSSLACLVGVGVLVGLNEWRKKRKTSKST